LVERFGHLHERDRTDIRAKGEAEINQVILAREVFMRHRLSLGVVKQPIAANVSFACVFSCRLNRLQFLFLLFILPFQLDDICDHKNDHHAECAQEHHVVRKPTLAIEFFAVFIS